jgi:TldD protein
MKLTRSIPMFAGAAGCPIHESFSDPWVGGHKSLPSGFVTGHDFSRADKPTKSVRALAPAARRLSAACVLLLAFFLCLTAPAQQTRADAEKDPILKAMLEEMDRSITHLQLPGFEKPFFIQYRIEEVDDYETKAEFGAGEGADHTHRRVARITVRVGDYKTDSSGGRGDGALELAGLDDDPIALRSALWTGTDQAYKSALSAYAQKQAALKEVQTPPQADDFSHEKPVISLAAPLKLKVDEDDWTSRVAQASGLYRSAPSLTPAQRDVQYASAQFHGRATTEWLVSSEGAIVRKSSSEFQEALGVGTQAADGMRLDRSYASTGAALKDLDTPEVFAKHAVELIASLAELRAAPLVEEEYHGPVLLSSDASACWPARSQPRVPGWAPRRAPTAPLLRAIMPACCPTFSTWSTIPA